jgi:hypothetical protein
MEVEEAPQKYQTPTPSVGRSKGQGKATKGEKEKKSNKVTESCFTPRTRHLAIASKHALRTSISIINPFPTVGEDERNDFIWKIIKNLAKTKEAYENTLARALLDDDVQNQLTTFVSNHPLFSI